MNLLHEIDVLLEKNPCTFEFTQMMRNIGLVEMIHYVQAKYHYKKFGGNNKEFNDFYSEHEGDYESVMEILDDEFSRESYSVFLEFLKNYNPKSLMKIVKKHNHNIFVKTL